MTVREFLRPTRAKWIMFALFFVGSVIIRYLIVFADLKLEVIEILVAPHNLIKGPAFQGRLAPGTDLVIMPIDLLFILIGLVLGLIYWYFLASVIYFIFSRLKK